MFNNGIRYLAIYKRVPISSEIVRDRIKCGIRLLLFCPNKTIFTISFGISVMEAARSLIFPVYRFTWQLIMCLFVEPFLY